MRRTERYRRAWTRSGERPRGDGVTPGNRKQARGHAGEVMRDAGEPEADTGDAGEVTGAAGEYREGQAGCRGAAGGFPGARERQWGCRGGEALTCQEPEGMSPKPPGPAEPWQPRGGPAQRQSKPKPAAARPGGSSQAGERKAAAQAARRPAESSAQKQPTPLHMVRRRGREPAPRAAPAPATGTGTDSIGGAGRPAGPGAGPAALPAPLRAPCAFPARSLRRPPRGARLRTGAVATPAAGGGIRGGRSGVTCALPSGDHGDSQPAAGSAAAPKGSGCGCRELPTVFLTLPLCPHTAMLRLRSCSSPGRGHAWGTRVREFRGGTA